MVDKVKCWHSFELEPDAGGAGREAATRHGEAGKMWRSKDASHRCQSAEFNERLEAGAGSKLKNQGEF
jgi:hypothetical protein